MPENNLKTKLRKLARRYQIADFRSGQEETMLNVLRGEDTLAIMPTGAGKSLCYQLPAQLLGGTTLVVSPLLSLMKDQHGKISRMGFVSQPLSSELTRKQTAQAIRRLGDGQMDIQFLTPEKLENLEVLAALRRTRISLFVIDEAHCISEWGHDFRPAYLTLSKAVETLGHPTILALTATATPEVMGDIQERLLFRPGSHVVRISYRRDNLILKAREFKDERQKFAALLKMLQRLKKKGEYSGIVYCASVRQTEALALELKGAGLRAVKYHGRMKKNDRRRAQERFMRARGVVMVATSAFGMGIDKPDVRFVLNYQIPSSIESYYQQVGRAGRDGQLAYGILFYTPKDRALQRVLQLRKYPNFDLTMRTLDATFAGGEIGQTRLEAEVGKKKLNIILKMLEASGLLSLEGRAVRPIRRPTDDEVALMLLNWDERKDDDRTRLEDVVQYVHTGLCRWYYLLRYFGEEMHEPCGLCDNCRKRAVLKASVPAADAQTPARAALVRGSYVEHGVWGVGEVLRRIGPNLSVYFPGVGEKILREDFVQPWIGVQPDNRGTKKVA